MIGPVLNASVKFLAGFFSVISTYFTTSLDSGDYTLSYIKSDTYRILAFDDKNNNLKLDPDQEPHAFLQDTLRLTSEMSLPDMFALLQDVRPIRLLSGRPVGSNFQLRYSKEVQEYMLNIDSMFSNLDDDNNVVKLYPYYNFPIGDSIQLIIKALDSLQNEAIDTVKVVFQESNRKPDDLSFAVEALTETLSDTINVKLTTNKPYLHINADSIKVRYDTLFSYNPISDTIIWNKSRTEGTLSLLMDKTLIKDTIFTYLDSERDSTQLKADDLKSRSNSKPKSIDVVFHKGYLTSIERDTSGQKNIKLAFEEDLDPSKYGIMTLNLNTNYKSYVIQLTDKNLKPVYQALGEATIKFSYIKPGDYKIKILVDLNGDGKWSFGNLLANKEPEKIIILPETISVRENFEIEREISF
jgi:hypothetical protein